MERRVLLAIFLSLLVLSVYQTLVVKPAPKRPAPVAANTPAERSPPATPVSTAQSPPTPAANPPAEREPGVPPLVSESSDRDVRIEINAVIGVLTNRDARLKSCAQ